MKAKYFKFSICVLMAVAVMALGMIFLAPTKVFAAGPAVGVQTTAGVQKDVYAMNYPTDGIGAPQKLVVDGFDFDTDADGVIDDGFSVAYSFLKIDAGGYVFNQFPNPVQITETNPNGMFEYNFFQNGGVGSYRVKGVVLKNGQIFMHLQEMRVTIKAPTISSAAGWGKKIEQRVVGTTNGDFQLFNFKVVISYYGDAIDLSNYNIKWYYIRDGEAPKYCGSGQSINWGAEELGVYTMTVQIDELGVNDAVEIGNMTKNYSMYAIIAFSALGFVLLVIAIITTIRKVKKERVW
ncbi:MAG: hypothetical protein IKK20_01775 [Clostridia bacterium]|nr:hypothetical protein [Clostridia bacterium]MBR3790514.1 hypothetical protein [Clostridia bacterium]